MLYHRLSAGGNLNGYQVKPVLIAGPALPQDPHGCNACNLLLFAPADRFQCASAYVGAAGLHLHEGNRAPFPYDEIEIVTAELEPMRFDRPAARGEESDSDPFPAQAKQLALVLPFGGRDEAAGARHGARYRRGRWPENRAIAGRGGKPRP
jgi:hypothetical protein